VCERVCWNNIVIIDILEGGGGQGQRRVNRQVRVI